MPPTCSTTVRFFRRMGGNVMLKMFRGFESLFAKCARKSDRVLGMFSFHVFRHVALVQVGFLTTEKRMETRSVPRAVDGVNMSPQSSIA